MNRDWLRNRTHAVKALKVQGYGELLEILPYVFLPFRHFKGEDHVPIDASENLIFLPHPKVDGGVIQDLVGIRVDESIFNAASRMLDYQLNLRAHIDLSVEYFTIGRFHLAAQLAQAIHLFQVDRMGVPYVDYLIALAFSAERGLAAHLDTSVSEEDLCAGIAAAWLHSSLEDSSHYFYRQISEDDLLDWGINERTIHILSLVRVNKDSLDDFYYSRILSDNVSRTVKLAELAQKTNTLRLRGLTKEEKGVTIRDSRVALTRLGFHPMADSWFQPIADDEVNFGIAFTSRISAEAFSDAINGDPLSNRFKRGAKVPEFERISGIAVAVQKNQENLSSYSDRDIIFGLFWQFYIILFGAPFTYNAPLIDEFYKRKAGIDDRHVANFYPLHEMSLAEIMKRAKRAKSNLIKYTRGNHDQVWHDRAKLDRDAAAELLLVAFGEAFESFERRVQVDNIKWFISACLDRMSTARGS